MENISDAKTYLITSLSEPNIIFVPRIDWKNFFFLILIMQAGIIFSIEYYDYLMYNLRQLQNGTDND